MSRKGDCWDNAVAESFFASLEFECVRDRVFVNYADAYAAIAADIDDLYNPLRLHTTINYLSPIEMESLATVRHMAAQSTCPLVGVKFARLFAFRARQRARKGTAGTRTGSFRR